MDTIKQNGRSVNINETRNWAIVSALLREFWRLPRYKLDCKRTAVYYTKFISIFISTTVSLPQTKNLHSYSVHFDWSINAGISPMECLKYSLLHKDALVAFPNFFSNKRHFTFIRPHPIIRNLWKFNNRNFHISIFRVSYRSQGSPFARCATL